MIEANALTRSEHVANRLVGFDVVQRSLIEQTLTKLYTNIQAKCQLKLELLSQQLMPPFVRQLIDSVPRSVIVEINCGYGFFSNYLSLCCPDSHIVGIDTNQDKIKEAQNTINTRKNLQFICQDLNKIPKIEADLIIFNIDNWDDLSVQQLQRIHQWLTPGGDLLIRTPHVKMNWQQIPQTVFTDGIEIALERLKHVNSVDMSEVWQNRITEAGFTCLAEYDAEMAIQSSIAQIAGYLNSYMWYHAEKPFFEIKTSSKFNPYSHTPKQNDSIPKLRYAQTQHHDHARATHRKEQSKAIFNTLTNVVDHDGDDVLGYIFSKPWKSLYQEIVPA